MAAGDDDFKLFPTETARTAVYQTTFQRYARKQGWSAEETPSLSTFLAAARSPPLREYKRRKVERYPRSLWTHAQAHQHIKCDTCKMYEAKLKDSFM